jgi:UDP-N-acetylglucosamine 2-epimerase
LKVLAVTGSSADFEGYVLPVCAQLKADGVEVVVFCCGESASDGPRSNLKQVIDKTANLDVSVGFSMPLGNCFSELFDGVHAGICDMISRVEPDMVLVMGDRPEMLYSAMASKYLGVPVAHIHAYDKSGHVDDITRRCVSAYSDLLLCASIKAYNTAKLSQPKTARRLVGSPTTDSLPSWDGGSSNKILVLLHPCSGEDPEKLVSEVCRGVNKAEKLGVSGEVLVVGSNTDVGGDEINAAARREFGVDPKFFPERSDFLSELSSCVVFVTNSSCGVTESPFMGVPTVVVGDRQGGRSFRPTRPLSSGVISRAIASVIRKGKSGELEKVPALKSACKNISDSVISFLSESKRG